MYGLVEYCIYFYSRKFKPETFGKSFLENHTTLLFYNNVEAEN